jgi:hypothetical protein
MSFKKQYPPGGSLSKSTSTNPKAPQYYGSIEVDEALIEYLNDRLSRGEERPKLELSGWKKDGNNGPFISLAAQVPYKERQGTQKPKASNAPGGYAARGKPSSFRRDSIDDTDDIAF